MAQDSGTMTATAADAPDMLVEPDMLAERGVVPVPGPRPRVSARVHVVQIGVSAVRSRWVTGAVLALPIAEAAGHVAGFAPGAVACWWSAFAGLATCGFAVVRMHDGVAEDGTIADVATLSNGMMRMHIGAGMVALPFMMRISM